jgi:hypothetical protein
MVLLYFNCKELCEHAEKYCPGPIQKPPRSYVLNCILDAYCDDRVRPFQYAFQRDQGTDLSRPCRELESSSLFLADLSGRRVVQVCAGRAPYVCVDCGKEVPKEGVQKILKAERYLIPTDSS